MCTHVLPHPYQRPQEGRAFQASLAALSPTSAADVVVVAAADAATNRTTGDSAQLTDASTCEDYEQLIKQLLAPLAANNAEGSNGGSREAFRGFVFLAGVHDEGIMGEAAFGRLLKFCQVRGFTLCCVGCSVGCVIHSPTI